MNAPPTSRSGIADLAKGIAVLLMIQVHLTELFAVQPFFHSSAGRISLFLGGPPVAPVFMAALGYFVAASRRSSGQLALRALALLVAAVLLNIGLNFHLLLKIRAGVFSLNPWEYIFGADILFLAAFSVLLLAVLRPLLTKHFMVAAAAALLVAAVSPAVTGYLTTESSARWAFAFVGGHYAWSYFPLFPWFAYPLLGYAFFYFHRDFLRVRGMSLAPYILLAGGLLVALTLRYGVDIAARLEAYYHHGAPYFGWTTLFMATWIAGFALLDRYAGQTASLRYVRWLGANVTLAYILQWLMIGNLGTWLYKSQSFAQLLLWYSAIVMAVSVAILLLRRLKPDRTVPASRPVPVHESSLSS